MREDWKPEHEPDMDKEIEIIKKWVADKNNLLDSFLCSNQNENQNENVNQELER